MIYEQVQSCTGAGELMKPRMERGHENGDTHTYEHRYIQTLPDLEIILSSLWNRGIRTLEFSLIYSYLVLFSLIKRLIRDIFIKNFCQLKNFLRAGYQDTRLFSRLPPRGTILL